MRRHAFIRSSFAALLIAISGTAFGENVLTPSQQRLKAIYRELVEINTTNSTGDCTEAAQAMAAHLRASGLPSSDIRVIVPEGAARKGNLVATYRGSGARRPIMLLGHLDVVEAKREDWQRDPFRLIEENGYFYARGTSDDKAMAAIFVENLIRYREEGFRPDRDLILALTCDEERISLHNGVEYLLRHHRNLIDAEYVLNEGAMGLLDQDGKHVHMAIQAGEKGVLHFLLEVVNAGGHSSIPSDENAIYRLSEALLRIARHRFPVNLSATTRRYFDKMAEIEKPEVAADMRAILRDPPDPDALARLSKNAFTNATLRTTCVATMVQAGHAMNALPQKATAQVNCRVLPNDSIDAIEKEIIRVVGDDKVSITRAFAPTISPMPELNAELLAATEAVTADLWPGIPVVPTLLTGATDGRFLNNAGVPSFGVSGLFRDPDGTGAHGLNERMRVRSLFGGHEFLYRLVKRLGAPDP